MTKDEQDLIKNIDVLQRQALLSAQDREYFLGGLQYIISKFQEVEKLQEELKALKPAEEKPSEE